jgi:AcrR family transcriptional regulator
MRTHGWSGSAPATDDEAISRILDAASKAIDARGADFSISDVARTLGVTRQTVYRYFPSTDAPTVAVTAAATVDPVSTYATAAPPNSPTVPAISHGR